MYDLEKDKMKMWNKLTPETREDLIEWLILSQKDELTEEDKGRYWHLLDKYNGLDLCIFDIPEEIAKPHYNAKLIGSSA